MEIAFPWNGPIETANVLTIKGAADIMQANRGTGEVTAIILGMGGDETARTMDEIAKEWVRTGYGNPTVAFAEKHVDLLPRSRVALTEAGANALSRTPGENLMAAIVTRVWHAEKYEMAVGLYADGKLVAKSLGGRGTGVVGWTLVL